MAVLSLGSVFGSSLSWLFGSSPVKLSGGNQPSGYGGGATYANRPVTPEGALQLAAFWACVKLIGQTIGTLPLRLYDLAPDGSRSPAVENPLFDLLQHQPCADHTGVEFWEGVGVCIAMWGNAYAAKTYRGDGTLIALDLLRPFWMEVYRDTTGGPVYRYRDQIVGTVTDYTPDQLMHVRGFGACDLVGLSPIGFARQTLGSAIAADETAGRLFSNGMKVGGWFKYKGGTGILNAEQRQATREALIEPFTGAENAHKVGILPGDFDWVATTMNPQDAQLLANRRMNVEEICRWFGIPPILIGHAAEGQTMWGTGQESIVRSFLTMGLRPLVHRIEAAIARDIIGRGGRKLLKAEFDLSELVRGDTRVQGDIDAQDVNNGLRNRNEVRATRNLPPIPGGEKFTVQSALLPIEDLGIVARLPTDRPVAAGGDIHADPSIEAKMLRAFELGLKFNPHHGPQGRFASADDAAAGEAHQDMDAAKHNIAMIAKGAALVAVASLAVWLLPEAAAGTLGAAAITKGAGFIAGAANGMFLNAGLSSAGVILHRMGVDTSRAERIAASVGSLFKGTAASDAEIVAELRMRLKDVADQTLAAALTEIEARHATSPNKTAVIQALRDACDAYKAKIAAMALPAAA